MAWVVTRYFVTNGKQAFTVPNVSDWNAHEMAEYICRLEEVAKAHRHLTDIIEVVEMHANERRSKSNNP